MALFEYVHQHEGVKHQTLFTTTTSVVCQMENRFITLTLEPANMNYSRGAKMHWESHLSAFDPR